MNAKIEVQSIRVLQARIDAAKAGKELCGKQVADAKLSFHKIPDEFNRVTLSDWESMYTTSANALRKANEAMRIFCFKGKSLTATGKLVRL